MPEKNECGSHSFSGTKKIPISHTTSRGTLDCLPSAGEIEQFMQFSRQTLAELPSDEEIRCLKLDSSNGDLVRSAMQIGKYVLRSMSGEHGNVSPDEAYSGLLLLHQQNMILTAAIDTAAPGGRSCVGTCRAEHKECIDSGTNKHRCNWDGFLCRMNCFFKIEVSVNPGA